MPSPSKSTAAAAPVTRAAVVARLETAALMRPSIDVQQQGTGCVLYCAPHQISDIELAPPNSTAESKISAAASSH